MRLEQFIEDQEHIDSEFAAAKYDYQPEAALMLAMVEARRKRNLTQQELAERTGIAQTEISRIESGSRNPSIKVLQRLADGMGMYLQIAFVRKDEQPSMDRAAHA